jgi:undecaprenyl-phosphate 4-deoxy-4-formamido-L-arabinose transferase
VEVTQKDRLAGSSGYNLRKLLGLWINGCTTFSIKPLRFATLTGMIIALIGFVTIIVIAVQKFVNPNMMSGWTSMIATMLLIGGLIMMMLGVIGEYIGRIYLSLNGSPQYVIRRIIDNRQESDVK